MGRDREDPMGCWSEFSGQERISWALWFEGFWMVQGRRNGGHVMRHDGFGGAST